jgi:hypothetical protein
MMQEILQKFTKLDPILILYFENDAKWAAVVEFWFWIEN